jgi:hypothetical protein
VGHGRTAREGKEEREEREEREEKEERLTLFRGNLNNLEVRVDL